MVSIYTIHCNNCFCVLGISVRDLFYEKTYCLDCAKKIYNSSQLNSNKKQGGGNNGGT